MAEVLLYEYKGYISGSMKWYKYVADKAPETDYDMKLTPQWPSDNRIYKSSAILHLTSNDYYLTFFVFRGPVSISRYRKDSEDGSYYLVDTNVNNAIWPDSSNTSNVYSTNGNNSEITVVTHDGQNYWQTRRINEGGNFELLDYYQGCPFATDLSATEWGNLIRTEYIPSSWQSVPSITGKGKTVQLSTLNDINNGEEVITDDTSKFNLTVASNLVTLVQK